MGISRTPQEAAPAYEDVYHDHPVNRYPSSGSTSAYTAVPKDDQVEPHAHNHGHTNASPNRPESQTVAKPHVHCEQCDVQLMAIKRRENEKYCCTMVARTFMTLFVCVTLLGIVITSKIYGNRRHGH